MLIPESSKLFPQSLYPASNYNDQGDNSESAKLKALYGMLDFAERAAVDQLRPERRPAILELTAKRQTTAGSSPEEDGDYWAQVVEIAKAQAAALNSAKPSMDKQHDDNDNNSNNVIHFIDPNVPPALVQALDRFTHAATDSTAQVAPLGDDFLPVLEFLDGYVLDVSLYRFAALRVFFAWLTRAAALTNTYPDYTYHELIMLQTKPGVVAAFLDRTTRLMAALEESNSPEARTTEVEALARLRDYLLRLQQDHAGQQQQVSFEELVTLSQQQMVKWLLTTTAVAVAAVGAGVWVYSYTDGAILTMSLKDLLEHYREKNSHLGQN